MKNEGISVKTIVAIGIGAAVFVILGRFIVIPTGFPDTNIETTYPFLALLSVVFGPITGLLTGLIGHAIKRFYNVWKCMVELGSMFWSYWFYYGWIGKN